MVRRFCGNVARKVIDGGLTDGKRGKREEVPKMFATSK